jgi:hypothetical protein
LSSVTKKTTFHIFRGFCGYKRIYKSEKGK